MDGLVEVDFQFKLPVGPDGLAANVASSTARGYEEADPEDGQVLNIVANGPSARYARFSGPALALNGALSLFGPGNPPALWAACDPQAQVAEFLCNAPERTTYLVASKCHPDVFGALADRQVKLWHIADGSQPAGVRAVSQASSITLCAIMLMARLGWRAIDVWGWDCCYGTDGAHHAGRGTMPTADYVNGFQIGIKRFDTNVTWVAELDDALKVVPLMEAIGTRITVRGDGMISAGLEFQNSL